MTRRNERKGSMWFTRGVDGVFRPIVQPPPVKRDKTRREIARAVLTDAVRTRIKIEADFTCTYCARQGSLWVDPDGRPWHMDHIVPLEAGGSIEVENVALACRDCNMAKGARTPAEWRPSA